MGKAMDNAQQAILHSGQIDALWQTIDFVALVILMFVAAVVITKYAPKRRHPHRKKRTNGIPVDNNYGDAGERMVRHQLQFLGPDYLTRNDIVLSGGGQRQQIDHLVVGPSGVYHIETKHWSGEVHFEPNGMRHMKNGIPTDDADPTAQMDRHDYVVQSVLREYGIHADVTGIICFTHPRCHLVGTSPRYATIKLDRLFGMIQASRSSRPLKPTEVQRIAAILGRHSQPTPMGYGQ